MPYFQVDSEQIQASSATVAQSVAQIRDLVNSMYAQLTNLKDTWHGAASQQFGVVAEQWKGTQVQVEQALEGIQHALATASNVYGDAETQASQLFAMG